MAGLQPTLGLENSILAGVGRRHEVRGFAGPLSLKSILSGKAVWRTTGEHVPTPGAVLILNDGQPYDMTVDSPVPVRTFCVFFRRGFVEDAVRVESAPAEKLLDSPFDDAPPLTFFDRVQPAGSAVATALDDLRRSTEEGREDAFTACAAAIARSFLGVRAEWTRVPGQRPATRAEIYRRLLQGREAIDAGEGSSLTEAARVACLSPYHFHRLFRAVFGETPHRYRMRRRLERAVELLTRTQRPLTDIALDSGFATSSALANAMSAKYGLSPRALRKRGF